MIDKVVVTFFNVGKGDATLLEIYDADTVYYVIYDICRNGDENPIVEYLVEKTKTVHAVIISHFHRDHISGIDELFSKFKINELFLPPYFHSKTELLDDILANYREEISRKSMKCSDKKELIHLSDYSRIIHEIKQSCKSKSQLSVSPLQGIETPFYLESYPVMLGKVFLPLMKFNDKIARQIENSANCLDVFTGMNDSSISILFEFFDRRLLITGDSEKNSWFYVRGRLRNRVKNFKLDVLKISHHGSKYNTDEDLLDYFFESSDSNKKYAIVSGDGKKHPAKELLLALDSQKINPYCTALSEHCIPKTNPLFSPHISSYFTEFLANYDTLDTRRCQGNIKVKIDPRSFEVTSERKSFCPYHV